MKTRNQQLSQIIQRVQSRLFEQAQSPRGRQTAAEALLAAMENFVNAVEASGASMYEATDALRDEVEGFIENQLSE
jgi:hypothetical protein